MMIPTSGFVVRVVFIALLVSCAITEVIEERDAVCLGPDPDLAGVVEGVVLDVEQVLAVEG